MDPVGGRVYLLGGGKANGISYVALSGAGGGDLPSGSAVFEGPYGLAFDSALQTLYWGNYGKRLDPIGAIGTLGLNGIGGGINIASAPLNGPQDPVILKSPAATAVPAIARGAGSARAALSCPTGTWSEGNPGGFVYQAPTTYAYQWSLGGAPLTGAIAPTLTATAPGSYTCTVTAANQAGSGAASSAAVTVKAAKFKLLLKTKKPKAKPGKLATIKLQALNQGDLRSNNSRVCVKLTKKQRQGLKQPKCKKLGKVVASKRKVTKLKIKLKMDARGTYKMKLVPKGTGGKASG